MHIEQTIAGNLRAILDTLGMTPKGFSDHCIARGLTTVNKSFISRFMNRANYGIEKINELIAGVNLLPGFEWVNASDLFTEGRFVPGAPRPRVKIEKELLVDCVQQMVTNMDEMEWITIKDGVELKMIANYCVVLLKDAGIDAVGRAPSTTASRKSAVNQ